MVEFSVYIRSLMGSAGMETIRDLAQRSELPEQTVARYLRGERFPDSHSLYKLARALSVTMEKLLTCGESNAEEEKREETHDQPLQVAESNEAEQEVRKVAAYLKEMDGETREIYLSIGAMLTQLKGKS